MILDALIAVAALFGFFIALVVIGGVLTYFSEGTIDRIIGFVFGRIYERRSSKNP